MRMHSKISVVVPVYNAEHVLERCINSVLQQTYTYYEIIVVDDGSTDSSGRICDQLKVSSAKISVIHQENKGVSAARNAGIDKSDGDFLFFLDSDDELYPDTFRQYIGLAEKHGAEIVIGSIDFISEEKNKKIGFSREEICRNDIWEKICNDSQLFGYSWGKLFRRSVIGNTKFNQKMISQEDLDFNLDVYNKCSKILCTPFTGYRYNYAPRNRAPQVLDYINNQIKLLCYARKHYAISDTAVRSVLSRISNYIYTSLYNTDSKQAYFSIAEKISSVNGISELAGEFKQFNIRHAGIVGQVAMKKYWTGYVYMRLRKMIAGIVRKIIS